VPGTPTARRSIPTLDASVDLVSTYPSVNAAQMAFVDEDTAPLVTTLPSSPYDGQQISFAADPTNGVIWQLRYRSASSSAHKWEFLGGPPMVAEQVATGGVVFNTSYGVFSYATLAVPLSGDHDVRLNAAITGLTGGAPGAVLFVGIDVSGAGANDAHAVQWNLQSTLEDGGTTHQRVTGLFSGAGVTATPRTTSAVTINPCTLTFDVAVTPVRVG
jgi:hypothetical protein